MIRSDSLPAGYNPCGPDPAKRHSLHPALRFMVHETGDSAHPTTPNMGSGACMAIESAYVLSRSLKEQADIRSALRRYESQRHARYAGRASFSVRMECRRGKQEV